MNKDIISVLAQFYHIASAPLIDVLASNSDIQLGAVNAALKLVPRTTTISSRWWSTVQMTVLRVAVLYCVRARNVDVLVASITNKQSTFTRGTVSLTVLTLDISLGGLASIIQSLWEWRPAF